MRWTREALDRWMNEDIWSPSKGCWVSRSETVPPEAVEWMEIAYDLGYEEAADDAAQDAAGPSL